MEDPWETSPGAIYLLHFDKPIGDLKRPRMSAQHYIGWTEDLDARLDLHRSGKGAAIMKHLKSLGIGFQLVWSRPGTRNDERALKKSGHFKDRLCTICRGEGCAL